MGASLISGVLSQSSETSNGGLGGHSGGGRKGVCTSSNLSSSALAFPDSSSLSLDALLLKSKKRG